MRKTAAKRFSWYTARCHFKSEIRSKRDSGTHLWEEAFFLVRALSKKDAERKAKHRAQRKKRIYENFAGDIISWNFAGVIDVCALKATNFGDGTEVYCRYFSREDGLDTSVRNKT